MSRSGLVFNIQRFSLHDGAGIRTLVFLKGCPLRCFWCCNPEGMCSSAELAFDTRRCMGPEECGACVPVCPQKALAITATEVTMQRERCAACGECAAACPTKAREIVGTRMTVEEVLEVVEKDTGFFRRSGGGLTLTGGEPLLQAGFVAALLEEAQRRGLHTAIETSGYATWVQMERVLRHVDSVLFDLKLLNEGRHRAATGVSNALILTNLQRLWHTFPEVPVRVRTPVVVGLVDQREVRAICEFLSRAPQPVTYELLPLHNLAAGKYKRLGRTKKETSAATCDLIEHLRAMIPAPLAVSGHDGDRRDECP